MDEEEAIVKNCGNCVNTFCYTCENNTACNKCRYSTPARVLSDACNCPEGYYTGSNYECPSCLRVCKSCDNGANCLTCVVSNPVRSTNMCVCPSGHFDDGTLD